MSLTQYRETKQIIVHSSDLQKFIRNVHSSEQKTWQVFGVNAAEISRFLILEVGLPLRHQENIWDGVTLKLLVVLWAGWSVARPTLNTTLKSFRVT